MTISHRGSSYAIGRGPGYYGIWLASAPLPHPVEWWAQTPQGWQDAWCRFTTLEPAGTIVAVDQGSSAHRWWPADDVPGVTHATSGGARTAASGPRYLIAPALLVVGVVLGIAGLFPGYLGGAGLARQPDELVPHAIYLAAWVVSAVLLLLGSRSRRVLDERGGGQVAKAGALVGIGTSVVTFGLFFADLGTVMSGGSQLAGTGLALSLIGWLACAAGSTVAVSQWRTGAPRRVRGGESVLAAVLTVLAVLGAAIAFAPSWDSFTLRTAAGSAVSVTAGNAFANPAPVIAGDVAVMALLVAAVVVAALWQPVRLGAALLAGAIVPMVAQAISAVIQIRAVPSPAQFGYSPDQARQVGLTIASGLTPAFWIYCAFVLALVLIGARMLTTPEPMRAAAEGPAAAASAGTSSAAPPGPAQLT